LAYEYKQGAIHTKIENDISMGIGWSISNPNPAFIGVGNGGTASTLSSDDHRLNFDKGDIYTQIIKGLHTLSFEYDDIGVFVRGKWWYDFEQQDHHHNLYDFNNQGRYRYAKGAGIELLDAYAFSRWKVNELDGEVRIGRQVINWGNDDYTHARNDLYAYDGNAYRRPGMILAEALIPAPTIYVSQKLNANTSIDLYYQYGWEKMAVSQCGTFFSTTDVIADGCTQGNLIYGSDFRPMILTISIFPVRQIKSHMMAENMGLHYITLLPQLKILNLASLLPNTTVVLLSIVSLAVRHLT